MPLDPQNWRRQKASRTLQLFLAFSSKGLQVGNGYVLAESEQMEEWAGPARNGTEEPMVERVAESRRSTRVALKVVISARGISEALTLTLRRSSSAVTGH